MSDYDELDQAILVSIDEMRDEYNACTARLVARTLGVSPDVVKYRVQKLAIDGLVSWNDVPGSLCRLHAEVPQIESLLEAGPPDTEGQGSDDQGSPEPSVSSEVPTVTEPLSPADDSDSPQATPASETIPAKSAAKKKPAAKKKAARAKPATSSSAAS